jgi:hypothetical protein
VVNVKILSYAQHSASVDEFNDPSGWNVASYLDDPIENLEPREVLTPEYRECALRMLMVLNVIDHFMSYPKQGPPREWLAVSLALGLESTQGRTETAVAEEWGVSRACISKDVTRVLRLTGLDPSWGLKTTASRQVYARTNGRHDRSAEVAECQVDVI